MNATNLSFLTVLCAGLLLGGPVQADDSIPALQPQTSEVATQSMVNGYLQIQAQLHDAQAAIEQSRREAAAEAKRNADALSARIQSLEDNLAAQRANELLLAQKNQQFMLLLAVAFGLVVVAAVLFMAYLQWRAVARIVELSSLRPPEFALGGDRMAASVVSNTAVEQANARLSGAVEMLQKRILELEEGTRAPLPETTTAVPTEKSAGTKTVTATTAPTAAKDRDECVANLLAEGQALLDSHEPEKALECFEVALGLEPDNAEALVKKGGALEKLGRTDEAIACYDHAIAADDTLTIAHLHKGGLFNRLARYDEALECYEQALRTQEKKIPPEKMARSVS